MENAVTSAIAVLVSSTKYIFGSFLAAESSTSLMGSLLLNIGGGLLGVVFFLYFWRYLRSLTSKYFSSGKKKTFSWQNRMLSKVRNSFGLQGIALLTPLITIPIGVAISLTITKNRMKIVTNMMASCVIWSAAFMVPYYLLDIHVWDYLKSMF